MTLPIACQYGPMYERLQKRIEKLQKRIAQSSAPGKNGFYECIFEALKEVTPPTASALSKLSHGDYPWILAGIQYWEYLPENRSKNILPEGPSNAELKEILRAMKEPDESSRYLMGTVVDKIERSEAFLKAHISPTDREPISTEYKENLEKFFTTPLSQKDQLVQNVRGRLFSQTFDLTKPDDRKTLREAPLLIFYCREISIFNIDATREHVKCLKNVLRYFFHLKEIEISYTARFKTGGKYALDIKKIIEAFNNQGVPLPFVDCAQSS